MDYAAIGTVPNLASRLCGEAGTGQILISQKVYSSVEELAEAVPVGDLSLKGFHRPVPVYEVKGLHADQSPMAPGHHSAAP